MSEPENFLTRWSRRKSQAAEPDVAPAELPDAQPQNETAEKNEAIPATQHQSVESGTTQPAFDPATLPPIDSIEAGTDITAFLRAGVPAELTRAALRRAWAADPAIRDFIGPSENAWDFTVPGAIPGFGPLSAEDASTLMAKYSSRIQEIASEVVDKTRQAAARLDVLQPPAAANADKLSNAASELSPPRGTDAQIVQHTRQGQSTQMSAPQTDETNSLHRDKIDVATQNNTSPLLQTIQPTQRSHGRALPK
jgi:Protein of unknown function (DUF3306)